MRNANDCVLIGDEGYSLTPFLMVPFNQPQGHLQTNFNARHVSARLKIEHSFGQLKKRFPILHYGVRTKLNKIPSVIATTFVLHNISHHLNDANDFDELPDIVIPVLPAVDNNIDMRRKGEQRRAQIAHLFI